MAKRKPATIGIDVGGTKILSALLDESFQVVAEVKEKTSGDKDLKHFDDNIDAGLEKLLREAEKKDLEVVAAGIGCAGFIDSKKGVLLSSPNIPFLKNYPFVEKVSRAVEADAFLTNDVRAGLYGEHQLGAAVGLSHVIGLFLGTGVGGALIMNGSLYTGADGLAGDIGQYLTDPMGPLAGSERLGILDNVVSRTAIAAEAAGLAAKNWAPHLLKEAGANVKAIKSETLAQAIKDGDKQIEDLVRSRARLLGIVMANLVNFLNPEMVVLGGGLVEAMPNLIVKEAEASMREHAVPQISKNLKVAAARLKDHAVTIGAAKLALDSLPMLARK